MKATCIVGSARSNGSVAYLIDTVIKGLKENGCEVKKYNIGEANIKFCRGCKNCYTDGKCIINDDVKIIVKDILTSDYVFIASPSYWAYLPAQLKTFIDRNTPYGDTNPNRILTTNKQPKGIAIAVRAGTREHENNLILDAIEHYFGHLGIEPIKRVSICETDSLEDLLSKHKTQIDKLYDFVKGLK